MKAAQVISEAYNAGNIVAAEAETPSAEQSQKGLFWLNNVLRRFSIGAQGNPYIKNRQISLVQGQESYVVPGLVKLHNLTYNLQTVRYALIADSVNNFFGTTRANGIEGLPYHFFPKRIVGGTELWFYFLPYQGMTLNITGMYGFDDVTFDYELDTEYDGYMQSYFIFLLTEALCAVYALPLPEGVRKLLVEYRTSINGINPPDFELQKATLFSGGGYISYAQANIGRGFVPV